MEIEGKKEIYYQLKEVRKTHVVEFRKTKRICRDEEKGKRETSRTIILYFWYLLSEKQYGHDAKFIDNLLHVRYHKSDQYSLKELIIQWYW